MRKVFFLIFTTLLFFSLSGALLVHAQPSSPPQEMPMGYGPNPYPSPSYWGRGSGWHRGPGMHGRGYSSPEREGWFCPWCGQRKDPRTYDYEPNYPNQEYDRGYRGRGWGMMPYHRWGPRYKPPRYPNAKWSDKGLSKEDAETLLNKELGISKNPNLKWGKITEHDTYYEAELLTKNNELVDKVQVHKYTGWFRSAYDKEE